VLDLARNGGWCGTVKTLLGIILESAPAEEKKFLPNTPRGLGRKLEEIAPLLRDTGVRIEKRRTNTGWIVILGTTGGDEATERVNVVSELSERPKNNVHRANPCKHWAGEHSERCECTFRQRIFDDISSDTSDLNPGNPHTSNHDSILRNNVHYVHNVHQVSDTNDSESERPFSNVHHVLANVHHTLATCSPQSASVVTNPFLIEDEDDEEDEWPSHFFEAPTTARSSLWHIIRRPSRARRPEVTVKQAREALNLHPGLEVGVLLALATLPEFPGHDALADMLEERAAIAECDLEAAARLLTLGPQPEDVYMGGDSNETH
jgi:hypothetical protein